MFITDKYLSIFKKPKADGGLGYKPDSLTKIDNDLRRFYFDAFATKGLYPTKYQATPEDRKKFYRTGKFFPYFLARTETVMNAIMALPEAARLPFLYVIKTIYDNMEGRDDAVVKYYQTEYDKLKSQRSELVLSAPTLKEQENTISDTEYDKVLTKYNEAVSLPSATAITFIRRLILALYKYIPPLRPQDYINTAFKGDVPNATNYIDLENKALVIREGKRTSEANARTIKLPDELVAILRETKEKLQSKWLIPMATDMERPMERTAFTHFLQNTFKKENLPANIGSTRLRNMKVSKLVDEGASAAEIKATANTMGHTVGTALTVYSKNSKRLHGEAAGKAEATDKDAIIAKMAAEIEELRAQNEKYKTTIDTLFELIKKR